MRCCVGGNWSTSAIPMNLLRNAAFRRLGTEISTTCCRLKAAFRVQGFKARNKFPRILTPALSPQARENLMSLHSNPGGWIGGSRVRELRFLLKQWTGNLRRLQVWSPGFSRSRVALHLSGPAKAGTPSGSSWKAPCSFRNCSRPMIPPAIFCCICNKRLQGKMPAHGKGGRHTILPSHCP